MSVKTSISLTDSQEAYARALVMSGAYPSLSAVLQRGLALLQSETDIRAAELAALRALLDERRKGPFVSLDEGRRQTAAMIAEKIGDDALSR